MTVSAAYADFHLATDDYHSSISDGRRVLEAVSLQDYSLRRAFTGKDPKKIIQNGKAIKNYIQLTNKNTAHFFGVGGTEVTSNPQLITEMETPWAMFRDDITWDEEIFDFHEGSMAERFVDLRRAQDQQCWNEKIRFLEEDACWATPNEATMESSFATVPPVRHVQSWPVLVNEETNAIPNTWAGNNVQGIDRSTNANWRPVQKSYLGGPQASGTDTFLASLSDTSRRTRFRGLPLGKGMYSDKHDMPAVIWCSFDGYTMTEESMRGQQDLYVYMGRQDPGYPSITIHGVPMEELPILSTAVIFPTGSAGVYSTELDTAGTTNAGPRFFFMNLKDMYVVVHSSKFFYKHQMLTPHNMPNRHSIFVDSYCNITAEQVRGCGIVYPGEDITGYGV